MKNVDWKSINRAPEGAKTKQDLNSSTDWKEVLVDIILKIITLGLYHVEKHKK